jgi:hypothetical protein
MEVYAYILSMVKDMLRVENTSFFYRAAPGPSMDRGWDGSSALSYRYRVAIDRYRIDITRNFVNRASRGRSHQT